MRHSSDLEQRLEQASEEVRRVAAHSAPPPIEEKGRPWHRGWMVFAAAFGAVVIAVGVLPMLSRSGDPDLLGEPSPTTTQAVTSTTLPAATTSTPAVTADCSAAGLPQPADQEGLPAPVAEARRAMAAAAVACDFDALEVLAGADLNTSFGGGGFSNIPRWEEEGTYPALELMVKLFDTPYAVQEFEGLPRYYVWPSAFVYDTWEEIPPADLEALLTVYTQEELDQYAEFGSYALWRIGITEDGTWKFFVAGD
ncbi:MAG: hypothetical protein ACRDZM_13925 [Acidimicrobiia bacterium]